MVSFPMWPNRFLQISEQLLKERCTLTTQWAARLLTTRTHDHIFEVFDYYGKMHRPTRQNNGCENCDKNGSKTDPLLYFSVQPPLYINEESIKFKC